MSLQFIMGNSGSGKSYCLYDTVVREAIEVALIQSTGASNRIEGISDVR